MFEPFDVVEFNYLWSHQDDRKEETGRYARPVCVVVKTSSAYFLFPITTVEPNSANGAVEIPAIERKRAGLKKRCWLISTEYNYVPHDALYDFASTQRLGSFSQAFMRKMALAIKAHAPARAIKRS